MADERYRQWQTPSCIEQGCKVVGFVVLALLSQRLIAIVGFEGLGRVPRSMDL